MKKKQTEEFLIEYHRLITEMKFSTEELKRLIVEDGPTNKEEE